MLTWGIKVFSILTLPKVEEEEVESRPCLLFGDGGQKYFHGHQLWWARRAWPSGHRCWENICRQQKHINYTSQTGFLPAKCTAGCKHATCTDPVFHTYDQWNIFHNLNKSGTTFHWQSASWLQAISSCDPHISEAQMLLCRTSSSQSSGGESKWTTVHVTTANTESKKGWVRSSGWILLCRNVSSRLLQSACTEVWSSSQSDVFSFSHINAFAFFNSSRCSRGFGFRF